MVTRRLLTGWMGLAVGSLVVAGLFAILVAFTRTPAVQLLGSANAFHLSLVAHVTFAFTVWFVAFAGAFWIYAAWRANYRLNAFLSWTGLAVAALGSAAMAVPAFIFSGRPYLNDYVPVIDHPLFWAGLAATGAGVSLQALAYLAAWWAARRRPASPDDALPREVPESLGMAVAAVAMLLAFATVIVTALTVEASVPFGYRLRALFWGGGHLLQYLHVATMASVWFVAGAVAVGARSPSPRVQRMLLWSMLPFMLAAAGAYLVWRPEELLVNHLVTILTFGGLGAVGVPLALNAAWSIGGTGVRPWGSPLFSGTALSFALFAIGGVMGVIGFSQDTRVPAHYHGMVGAVTLAYMAVAPTLLDLTGRRQWSERLACWQPYLYGLGLLGLMVGMHWAGGHGAPRKTFGFSWANAPALVALNLMGLGSLLAVLGGLAFVLNVGVPLVSRRAGSWSSEPTSSR
ncbi:MAG: cbb3-type cytochrome c oxidase subunit I [Candidatus Rokubacteria bacterium]|nr:cbb3-type cytochrome c oxidase subunit I [Candidatus Rokubacteria bacterium]